MEKEYIEKLYRSDIICKSTRHKTPENRNQDFIGSSIMNEEIELATKELKRNKAIGFDNLNRELLIALEGTGKKKLSNIIINV